MKPLHRIIWDSRYVRKILIAYFFTVLLFFIYLSYKPYINDSSLEHKFIPIDIEIDHDLIVETYYDKRELWNTSNLGTILFKNVQNFETQRHKKFVVLIWKYWDWLKNRHISNFHAKRSNPLEGCSVKNCMFTGDDDQLDFVDAVIIHIQRGVIPEMENRKAEQIWIFLNDESPIHAFSLAKKKPDLAQWANVFNWSMTYRTDADIPVPYGRTVPLQRPQMTKLRYQDVAAFIPNWQTKKRDVLLTVLMSNCVSSYRTQYLSQLKQHITVDIYGLCSDSKDKRHSCPGHFKSDCDVISNYLFYLVLENSECHQYLTEKVFNNAYSKGAIPIILGPPAAECETLLPPHSYLHVDDFETAEQLALRVQKISEDEKLLLSYHLWRNDFEVRNEHGYFSSRSYHLCRVCEALNYNSMDKKVYNMTGLMSYFDSNSLCKYRIL